MSRGSRARVAVVYTCALLLSACPRPDTEAEQAAICGDDAADIPRCAARCEEIIAPYRRAVAVPATTVDAQCRRFNAQVGCACFAPLEGRSIVDLNTSSVLVDRGDFFINDNGCGAVGRPGDCLHDPAGFPGCVADTDNGDAVCDVVCADLDEARRDDADGREDIEVLQTSCNGGCECAVGFGGVCTVVFGYDSTLPDPQGVTPFPFTDAAGCP